MPKNHAENLRRFYRTHRRMPSVDELRQIAGFKSKHPASKLINRLIHQGLIAKDAKGRLIPKKLVELPVLGTIAAGSPHPPKKSCSTPSRLMNTSSRTAPPRSLSK